MDKTLANKITKHAKSTGSYGITACATADALAGVATVGADNKAWKTAYQTFWDMVSAGKLRKNPRTNLTYVLA